VRSLKKCQANFRFNKQLKNFRICYRAKSECNFHYARLRTWLLKSNVATLNLSFQLKIADTVNIKGHERCSHTHPKKWSCHHLWEVFTFISLSAVLETFTAHRCTNAFGSSFEDPPDPARPIRSAETANAAFGDDVIGGALGDVLRWELFTSGKGGRVNLSWTFF